MTRIVIVLAAALALASLAFADYGGGGDGDGVDIIPFDGGTMANLVLVLGPAYADPGGNGITRDVTILGTVAFLNGPAIPIKKINLQMTNGGVQYDAEIFLHDEFIPEPNGPSHPYNLFLDFTSDDYADGDGNNIVGFISGSKFGFLGKGRLPLKL